MTARHRLAIVPGLLLAAAVAGCSMPGAPSPPEATTIRIAKQPGLGYLGLIVMREKKLLGSTLPTSRSSGRS